MTKTTPIPAPAPTRTAPAPTPVAPPTPAPTPAAPAAPAVFLQPLNQRIAYVKAVLYGKEGTGKSTSAASASQLGRVLFIDAEGGLVAESLTRLGAKAENILVWPPDQQPITSASLEDLHRQLLAEFAKDPEFLHTIVLDSMTEIHHLLREQATAKRVRSSRVEIDPDYIDRNDYGVMTNQLRKLIRRFRDLPCNVVFIALEKDATEEDGGRKEFRPALTAALATDVLGYADIVGRFGSADGSFRARFRGNDRIRAKDRYGKLPEVLHEPSLVRIYGWIHGQLDEETDQIQREMLDADNAASTEKLAAAKKQ